MLDENRLLLSRSARARGVEVLLKKYWYVVPPSLHRLPRILPSFVFAPSRLDFNEALPHLNVNKL
jgi:hypothetical protein